MGRIKEVVSRLIEERSPIVSFCVVVLVYWVFDLWRIRAEKVEALLGVTVSVAAIAVGFIGTAKSILISVNKAEVVEELKKAEQYHKLVNYLISGIWSCLVLVVFSALLLLLDFSKYTLIDRILVSLWFGLCAYAAIANGRVIFLFTKVLKLL